MRNAIVLSVFLIGAGAGSASAQYGGYEPSIAQSLDNISWDLFLMRLNMQYPLSSSLSLGELGGGFMPVYQPPRPTKSQWKHYYRYQKAVETREAKRAAYAARKAAAKR